MEEVKSDAVAKAFHYKCFRRLTPDLAAKRRETSGSDHVDGTVCSVMGKCCVLNIVFRFLIDGM